MEAVKKFALLTSSIKIVMNLKLEEFTKWKNITSRGKKKNFLSENVKNSNTIMDH